MKLSMALCFFVSTLCYAQNEALFEIINLDSDLEVRQQKIDSLIAVNEQNLLPIQLADFYHDLARDWFLKNWWVHGSEEDIDNAIFYTNKSLVQKKELSGLMEGSRDKTLFNLGYFNFLKGNVFKAIDIYKSLVKNGKGDLVQDTNFELGASYASIGDFYKALDRFNEFIRYYRARDSLDRSRRIYLADVYIIKAETYAQMGNKEFSEEIRTHLITADSILKKGNIVNNELDNLINHSEGNWLLKIGNYPEAINLYRKVLKDSANLNFYNLAVVYNSLGSSYIALQDFDMALFDLNKAISYDANYTNTYESLGDLYLARNQFEKGLFNYQKAIVYAIDKSKEISYDDLPKIKDLELAIEKNKLLNHIVTKANGWIKYYEHDNNKEHLSHALETFTLADQLVDLIRYESTEYQSKLYWREQSALLYMKAVEVCYLLNKPAAAFHFMERNKALLLLEDLTNEEAKEISNLPNQAAEREFNLKRAIFLSENNLQEASDKSNEAMVALKDTIREAKYRYEQFVDSLNESYPDYAKFKNKAAVLVLKDLKTNYVSSKKAVLHYILNEDQGYGLLTLVDTTLLYKMDNIPKLNKDVETLIATLSDGVSDIDTLQKISNTVFRQLLPENIYGKIKGKQLLIIPDYTLQRIPFEAFVVNTGTKPKYLIEDVEIGYAYSASLLEHTQHKERNNSKNFVGFAPIQFTDTGLAELHFSEKEITGIANMYPGETLINGQATKANFLENVGGHKIVHLATHADVGDGENPWIAFSDSKMYLKEIYATRNQADMVVLSACNTSNGALKRGEGVMSLARGFFYCGAKSVVSTLWPATDESGTDILVGFYKNLKRGDSKSKALQKTKLDYLGSVAEEELKHPFYWAGFIVVGDNAPVSDGPFRYWILLAVGLALVLFLIFRHRLFKLFQ